MFDNINRKLTGASYTIFLKSEEYDQEEFTYGTLEEAKEGFERLKESCSEQSCDDDVERTLTLCLYKEIECFDTSDAWFINLCGPTTRK